MNWTVYFNTPYGEMSPAFEFLYLVDLVKTISIWALCIGACWLIVWSVDEIKKKEYREDNRINPNDLATLDENGWDDARDIIEEQRKTMKGGEEE